MCLFGNGGADPAGRPDRIQAEAVLQEALVMEREAGEEVRQADTMRREFLATVSHELRSPLTILIGLVPLLRDRAPEHASLIEPIELRLTIHRPFVSGLPVGEFVIAGETSRAFRLQTSWRLLGPWAQRSPVRTRLAR